MAGSLWLGDGQVVDRRWGVATAEDAEHERILGPGVAEAAHRRHRDGVHGSRITLC